VRGKTCQLACLFVWRCSTRSACAAGDLGAR
jgi:hypothetical protein